MKKLSRFDLIMIIVFTVITLAGGGGIYYLSSQLDATKGDVSTADSDFQKYSSREVFLPTVGDDKVLQTNIDLLQAQLNPLIQGTLQAPGNKLATIVNSESPVDWKHDLDAEASRLNKAAKVHGVIVPNNFYYGFSRYLDKNPSDEQTVVLSKQLLGVEQIANIFINAPVRSISTFRRTYEEDPVSTENGGSSNSTRGDLDVLPGRSLVAPGNVYISYPFEIEFEANTEAFRKIIADLQKSPYVFVIRTLAIQNSSPLSPQITDLDKLAGVSPDASGAVATPSTKGPQFLFGNETLHIKVRIDMIEWNGIAKDAAVGQATRGVRPRTGPRGGNE